MHPPKQRNVTFLSHMQIDLSEDEKIQESKELDESIEELGGRLTDLEFLARRIRTGEGPSQAVSEIIKTSANEILKLYFLGDPSKRNYSKEQAWAVINMLSQEDSLKYNKVLLHGLFSKGGDDALSALEQAELIAIVSHHGRPYAIKAGKPVYRAAFRMLLEDHVLKAKMDMDVATELAKAEATNIAKYEEELRLLGELPSRPPELAGRIAYLLNKLKVSQTNIEKFEKEIGGLKKILQTQF